MIPVLTRMGARAHDQRAIAELAVPGQLLMENAGRGAADWLLAHWSTRLSVVVVVGGTGQNGGDAWVVARHLRTAGVRAQCVLVGNPERIGGDALGNFLCLPALGLTPVLRLDDSPDAAAWAVLASLLQNASLVVDGLFGTGLDRPVEGMYRSVVEAINHSATPVLALDVPSGIDVDTGAVLGVAVAASATTTFAAIKQGMTQEPARSLCGTVHVCHIGVPGPGDATDDAAILEDSDLRTWLAPRPRDLHKHRAGQVMVFAGDSGKTGAALLCGHSALRAGAGLVTLLPRQRAYAALDAKVREMMTLVLPEEDPDACLQLVGPNQVAVVGPGFGLDQTASALVRTLAIGVPGPAVLDADALRILAEEGATGLANAAGPRVLTPHPGEAAALLGIPAAEVQSDRCAAALALAEQTRQVVVLKGAGTVVAGGLGRLRICQAGTPAMAVAGMGDVLAGVVAALLCHLPPLEAACAAVQLHGRAGERAAQGDRGLLASEVADALPSALQAIAR